MSAIGKLLAAMILLAVVAFTGGALFAPQLTGSLLGQVVGEQPVEDAAFDENTAEITGDPYPGDPDAEAALVDAESERLVAVRTAASAGPSEELDTTAPFRLATEGRATLILPESELAYDLPTIAGLAPDTLSASGPKGAYVLHEHLAVMEGAVMIIGAGERLLLAGDESGFSTVVALGGVLRIEGTGEDRVAIESWNPATGGVDDVTADGRPYISVVGGELQVTAADLSALGFWSGETGGLSYDGDRGADRELGTLSVGPDGAPTAELTEPVDHPTHLAISSLTVRDSAFGLTVAGVDEPTITKSAFLDNLADGLVLDRAVTGAKIKKVEASRNARDGIVVDSTTTGTRLSGLVVAGNGRNGLVLDGTPPAEGPNSAGAETSASGDSAVDGGTFDDNARAAIDVVGGTTVSISGVEVTGGDMGIVIDAGAADVEVTDSTLSRQTRHAISVRDDAQNIAIRANEISTVEVGVYVRNAHADVMSNVISDVELHGIVLAGQLAGSRITDNELSGTGPSAINDERALRARVEANLIDGWATSRSIEQVLATLMQPLTVVWMLVVTLVIVALITRLGAGRKRGDPLRDPRPLQSLSRGVFDRSQAGRFGG
jgi:hypothetical protein